MRAAAIPAAAALLAALMVPPAISQEVARPRVVPRVCVTEPAGYYHDSPELIARRLDLYERLGVGVIRVETGWETGPLVREVQGRPLRVKLILYVLGMPPGYGHPEEAMTDQHGISDWHLGPWHTELEQLVTQAADAQMQRLAETGVLSQIDEVASDLGPAGEGIYPANWTLGRDGEEAFWCYSPAAQADFRRAARDRYGVIEAANEAWRLAGDRCFADWGDVAIPQPGTAWARGPFWNDMLTWYRDAKRRLMELQINNTIRVARKYLGDRARVIVYLPGWAYTQEDWDAAVAMASGPASIRLMMDNDWLMAKALEKGCILQYTGVENATEVARIAAKLKTMGYDDCSAMWGENAGIESSGRDPLWLAEVISAFGLRGLDYTWASWLFEDDHITPSVAYPLFAEAVESLRRYGLTGEIPRTPEARGECREVRKGEYELTCEADTRLLSSYPQHPKGSDPEIAVVEGGQTQRILLRFPVEQLPAAGGIDAATLVMRGNMDYGDVGEARIGVYRVTAAWRERAVTWLERSLAEPWETPGGDAAGLSSRPYTGAGGDARPYGVATVGRLMPGDAVEWDVTELVEAWHAGRYPNNGMLLGLASDGPAVKSFCSRECPDPGARPKLLVRMRGAR